MGFIIYSLNIFLACCFFVTLLASQKNYRSAFNLYISIHLFFVNSWTLNWLPLIDYILLSNWLASLIFPIQHSTDLHISRWTFNWLTFIHSNIPHSTFHCLPAHFSMNIQLASLVCFYSCVGFHSKLYYFRSLNIFAFEILLSFFTVPFVKIDSIKIIFHY